MSLRLPPSAPEEIVYPDSDGEPMADNTLQFEWIVTIKENLELLFRDPDDVFVAGDLLWYPLEGHSEIRAAPDALVVFGRPKGYRGSYPQWKEGGVAPQVVFEVLSPGNRPDEIIRKFRFYERYGVQEYYVYDPNHNWTTAWIRRDAGLEDIVPMHGWVSPLLGVRFETAGPTLKLFFPSGEPFLTFSELAAQRDAERERAEQEHQRAEQERLRADEQHQRAEQERERAEQERQRAERLAAQLRAAGIEPEA